METARLHMKKWGHDHFCAEDCYSENPAKSKMVELNQISTLK